MAYKIKLKGDALNRVNSPIDLDMNALTGYTGIAGIDRFGHRLKITDNNNNPVKFKVVDSDPNHFRVMVENISREGSLELNVDVDPNSKPSTMRANEIKGLLASCNFQDPLQVGVGVSRNILIAGDTRSILDNYGENSGWNHIGRAIALPDGRLGFYVVGGQPYEVGNVDLGIDGRRCSLWGVTSNGVTFDVPVDQADGIGGDNAWSGGLKQHWCAVWVHENKMYGVVSSGDDNETQTSLRIVEGGSENNYDLWSSTPIKILTEEEAGAANCTPGNTATFKVGTRSYAFTRHTGDGTSNYMPRITIITHSEANPNTIESVKSYDMYPLPRKRAMDNVIIRGEEPSCFVADSGRVYAYYRTREGQLYYNTSHVDDLSKWTDPEPTGIVNPASKAQVFKTSTGKVVLVGNNNVGATNRGLGERNELVLWVSDTDDPPNFNRFLAVAGSGVVENGSNTSYPITGISKASNAEITITSHGFTETAVNTVALFLSYDIGGMTQIRGKLGIIKSIVDTNRVTVDIDSTSFSTYTTGGRCANVMFGGYPQYPDVTEWNNSLVLTWSELAAFNNTTIGTNQAIQSGHRSIFYGFIPLHLLDVACHEVVPTGGGLDIRRYTHRSGANLWHKRSALAFPRRCLSGYESEEVTVYSRLSQYNPDGQFGDNRDAIIITGWDKSNALYPSNHWLTGIGRGNSATADATGNSVTDNFYFAFEANNQKYYQLSNASGGSSTALNAAVVHLQSDIVTQDGLSYCIAKELISGKTTRRPNEGTLSTFRTTYAGNLNTVIFGNMHCGTFLAPTGDPLRFTNTIHFTHHAAYAAVKPIRPAELDSAIISAI